jgi:hypothetical protein
MLNGLLVAESLRVDTGFCAESLSVTWVVPWEVSSGRRQWTGQASVAWARLRRQQPE